MQRISKISVQGPLERISTGFPHDLLTRIWTRSCKDTERISQGPFQELSQGHLQDHANASGHLGHDVHARARQRISQDRPTRTYSGADLTRSWYKNPPMSLSSVSSSCKDLLERISPGSPQDLLLRTWTGSCKDLLERKLAGSPQEPVHASIYNENAAGPELENPAVQTSCERAQSKCAWTSHKSKFVREFTGKMPRPQDRDAPFVQACAVDMPISCDVLREFSRKKPAQDRTKTATLTLCEPAQLKCTWISHKTTFMREFTAKMPRPEECALI